MAKKEEIKEEIAHLLMRNRVGLLENAIIQQVTASSNVDAITAALQEMAISCDAKLAGKRWEITPLGRSFYADQAAAGAPAPDAPETTDAAGIERVNSFKTPDGKIHATEEEAQMHQLRMQLLPAIDAFMVHIDSNCKQKGLVRSYITRWEKFKREQSA